MAHYAKCDVFICTAHQEIRIISPSKNVHENLQKQLLYVNDSFTWDMKKIHAISPLLPRSLQTIYLTLFPVKERDERRAYDGFTWSIAMASEALLRRVGSAWVPH